METTSLHIAVSCIVILTSYFMGNISPATVMGKLYSVDIRSKGSGNPGTTNVLRTLGKKAAAITLAVDVLKGLVPVMLTKFALAPILGSEFAETLSVWAGFSAILGHIFPVAFGFKGGKGVATTFGVLIMAMPLLGLLEFLIMASSVLISRMVSLGAVIGALAFPLLVSKFEPEHLAFSLCLALLVLYKHNENIGRIVRGEENKISFKK